MVGLCKCVAQRPGPEYNKKIFEQYRILEPKYFKNYALTF